MAFQVAQVVKNPYANAGDAGRGRRQSLGQEDPLEEEMVTHSSILAWKTPWTEESDRLYSPWSYKESEMTEHTNTYP